MSAYKERVVLIYLYKNIMEIISKYMTLFTKEKK